MRLDALFKKKTCPFAVEIFPPKRTSKVDSVYGMLERMKDVRADYISVTYSAGGAGATEYTPEIARHLKQDFAIEPLAHLTCITAEKGKIDGELQAMREAGVENILALRGDLAAGMAPGDDFRHASDLMEEIRRQGNFYVVGACYPEGHPESESLATDVDNLRRKLEAGAGHLVSQLFFDNGRFYGFLNLARKKGITCPIEAGVMPIVRTEQIERMISLSAASVPAEISHIIARFAGDEAAFREAGIDYAIRQIRDLIECGVDGIHLYAMNNAAVAKRIRDGVEDLL